jgi:diaminopimelate epimerase
VAGSVEWLKGHGTENDFLLLPDPDGSVHGELDPALVAAVCDRRRGVGADGVLRVIRCDAYADPAARAAAGRAEWFMDYRNADGSTAQMCGNGLRVLARYLWQAGLADEAADPLPIGTRSGVREVAQRPDGQIRVAMGPATVGPEVKVTVGGRSWPALSVEVGNPHAVAFVDDLDLAGSLSSAPAYDAMEFPAGVNVEFVTRPGPGRLAVRVYERGVGETRSCGTGACAAAVAARRLDAQPGYAVDLPGGRLDVSWSSGGELLLTGPAQIVARGEFSWPKPG